MSALAPMTGDQRRGRSGGMAHAVRRVAPSSPRWSRPTRLRPWAVRSSRGSAPRVVGISAARRAARGSRSRPGIAEAARVAEAAGADVARHQHGLPGQARDRRPRAARRLMREPDLALRARLDAVVSRPSRLPVTDQDAARLGRCGAATPPEIAARAQSRSAFRAFCRARPHPTTILHRRTPTGRRFAEVVEPRYRRSRSSPNGDILRRIADARDLPRPIRCAAAVIMVGRAALGQPLADRRARGRARRTSGRAVRRARPSGRRRRCEHYEGAARALRSRGWAPEARAQASGGLRRSVPRSLRPTA